MFMYVHGVPPVHGKLIHIKGTISFSNELTADAMLIWLSTSLRSNCLVNCSTSHSLDHFLFVWLSFDSGWQHTSTISLLASDLATGPPVLGIAAEGCSCTSAGFAKALEGFELGFGEIAKRCVANFHFSAFTNGFVKMSAACRTLDP